MHLGMFVEMAEEGLADRIAIGPLSTGWTFSELAARAKRAGIWLREAPGERVVLVDLNSEAVPLCLFGAALAGKPFVPVNYRLTDDQLRAIVTRTAPATLIAGDGIRERIGDIDGIHICSRAELLAASADTDAELADGWSGDPDDIAVLLFTSGTTGEPKAAVLRHRNLTSYVVGTVEFGSAARDEAAVVSVPPYHIAGVSAVISSTYSGRRVVYLESFEAEQWVQTVRAEATTHAMVVPTMLGRILDVIDADGRGLPSLRALSYGGGPMPLPVIERAMRLLPDVGLVNAYGLTETSSTVAILGPDDHRAAFAGSRSRSVILMVRLWKQASAAKFGYAASRWPASTWAIDSPTMTVGSTHEMAARLTPTATCSCTVGSMTSSCEAARTFHRAKLRRCYASTLALPRPRLSVFLISSGARRWSPLSCEPMAHR
jgi:fatty-acyl-CoA synthase